MIAPVTFAVVGCGHIGKRHAAMISAHPEAQLVALCDIRPAAELKLEAWQETPFFPTIEELLAHGPAADVVCICTPNGLHETHALQALRTGHHVVIEKPMALTKAGCERIIFEALHQRREVFCVMQNRYSPPAQWLKGVVSQGILGQIYAVEMSLFWNRDHRYYQPGGWHGSPDLDGGALFTQFSHFVDILYWVFGDVVVESSSVHNLSHPQIGIDDSGVVQFRLASGGIGSLAYSTSVWDRNLESSLTIVAEYGAIKISGQYMNEVQYAHIRDYQMPPLPEMPAPNDYGGYQGSAANHHHVFQNVVDVLRGRGSITTNALEGMKTVEIIEDVYRKKR